ncbi:MAG: hypothetical protein IJB36_03810 [Clostridia bacterium]|nr:hypothetical protein [Clostridia bacterium]
MIQYPTGARYCGTCKYWNGDRDLTGSGGYFRLDSSSDGKCTKTGKDMVACKQCSSWVRAK